MNTGSKNYTGHVPDTLFGIEDEFVFVNLDMDLYQPMFEGLKYFWDKMIPGGMILLHDYFLPDYPLVKKAVEDFEKYIDTFVLKIPCQDCRLAIYKNKP